MGKSAPGMLTLTIEWMTVRVDVSNSASGHQAKTEQCQLGSKSSPPHSSSVNNCIFGGLVLDVQEVVVDVRLGGDTAGTSLKAVCGP